jgi:hypothetical protein
MCKKKKKSEKRRRVSEDNEMLLCRAPVRKGEKEIKCAE